MTTKAKIFYVEDDTTLSFVTKDNLEINGYQVDHFEDGKEALKSFSTENYDLCILDVMLPTMDGFELAKEIRKKHSQIPILFLTAKSLKEDRINGLKIGGDDYITKPFSIEELMLKIEVFLKRKYVTNSSVKIYNLGDFTFDYPNLQLEREQTQRKLTQKEGDLLKLLIEEKNSIVKRGNILERIWGENDYFLGRSLDVFISRLRKYLSDDSRIIIENVHGVGFRLVEQT